MIVSHICCHHCQPVLLPLQLPLQYLLPLSSCCHCHYCQPQLSPLPCHCQAQWSPSPSTAAVPNTIIVCCHHYCHCCLLHLPLPSYDYYEQQAPIDFALDFLCPLMLHHMIAVINKLQLTLHLNFFSIDVATHTITINS